MASWAEDGNARDDRGQAFVCLACGSALPESLVRAVSLRCGECRSANEPLNAELVEGWRADGAHLH